MEHLQSSSLVAWAFIIIVIASTPTVPSMRVRVTFPPKMGPIPPEIMYFLCIVTCFDVSAMYLKCISSVVFGAFGRLVSLCIVYVSSVHSHVSFLCLVPSFMLLY